MGWRHGRSSRRTATWVTQMSQEVKYCKHCQVDHPLTKDFWQRIETSPRCRIKIKDYNSNWRAINSKRHLKLVTVWKENNPDRVKQHKKTYFQQNKTKIIAKHSDYCKTRRKTDVQYRLAYNLRRRLNAALRKGYKSGSAINDLGCSIEEFRIYLESKFQPGMTWSNYGSGWHVDHIRPLANYDLSNREIFLQLVHYTNLQPLWAADNIRKSNKE